jgi:uncharacterized metal-binding protein YceD (DUF177 family)
MTTHKRLEAPKSFRIRAENVPVHGFEVKETLSSAFIDSLLFEPKEQVSWKVLSDTPLFCKIEHEADFLLLKGGGHFSATHPCIRCMEDVEVDVQIDFNTRLLPSDKDPDQELDLDAETFDDAVAFAATDGSETVASYYDDGVIDLTQLLREQLFLELPLYPSCDGPQAKNPKECDAETLGALTVDDASIIEHPFARLKDWKRHDA